MEKTGRGIEIIRDTANVEPYLKMGNTDIVTQEMGGVFSLTSTATTQNTATILSVIASDGSAAIDLLVVSVWGSWHFNFMPNASANVWERVLPINSWHVDTANRNLQVDALKNGVNLQIRVRIPTVAASSITDFQWHAKLTGRLLSYSVPGTLGFSATAPVGISPTAHISMLQDKTTIVENAILQTQSANHYGTAQASRIHRILNAATFANGTTTNTAIHIVLETAITGISSQTVKIEGSIRSTSGASWIPLSSTCHAYLLSATSLNSPVFVQARTDYTWLFYIATSGIYANKLVLKLVVSTSVLSNTNFIVDTIAGRGGGNAMKVTAIVENTGANL